MPGQDTFAIKVENLVKRYGVITALKGISFTIKSGELFALLGPNGAGKTTTIRILCGLTRPTGGQAFFYEVDVFKEPIQAKKMVGLVPQAINLDLELTLKENLLIHGLLFGLSREQIRKRSYELLRFAELWDRANEKVKTLSGGMRRRLLIIRALLHQPRILFLDEPTVGLDPHIRRKLWGLIKSIQQKGTTILLTTHYIEEAEFLADRVAFINAGRLVAIDTPQALMKQLGEYAVDIVRGTELETKFFPDRKAAEEFSLKLSNEVESVILRRINLEDAFVYFTGRKV
ncbi:ABC transporter related protein [Thermodesulfatator indicus DSM 15286]|uniref:ABC transporter related protein n=1 Tax=Thermodesulfatator indicus (strain DSM 15286 / JCM 11887 / CIR29812) TaxID=667014 RepID=F8AB55_THEID|nr:ATP-binding cassette domain-containing protein [Thermodesulfatator indicus]AEH45511.1 ABC transporter related protein [Thermodesulfatator indicus DSM 15286]